MINLWMDTQSLLPTSAEVVSAVSVRDADILETSSHLHVLHALVLSRLTFGGVHEGLGCEPSQ